MIGEMAVTAAKALHAEICNKKATTEHMSSDGGILCWDNAFNYEHEACMFKISVNDPSEKYLEAMTLQIQYYCRIVLTNVGGVSQVRVNGDLLHGFHTCCKNKNT